MKLIVLILVLGFCSCTVRISNSQTDISKPDSILVEQRLRLKEFALCECLRYGYPETPVSNDISISMYYNALSYGRSVIVLIGKHSKEFAEKIPASDHIDYDKQKPIMAACIEWYKSKKLDSLVKAYDYWPLKNQ